MVILVYFQVVKLFHPRTMNAKIQKQKAGHHNQPQDLQALAT
jgi:hypothetical protein